MKAAEFYIPEGCFISEWLNTAEDSEVSIARARVPRGVTTRWHRLGGITERYVILEGSGRAYVGSDAPRDVGPGDVVRIPANSAQRIANIGEGELIFLAICTPRFVQEAYAEIEC